MRKQNECEANMNRFLFACRSTVIQHSYDSKIFSDLLVSFIDEKSVNYNYFTNVDNSRNFILDIDYYKFINILLYSCYRMRNEKKYENIFNRIDFDASNIYEYFEHNKEILFILCEYFCYDFVFGNFCLKVNENDDRFSEFLCSKIIKYNPITGFRMNPSSVNNCREEVLNGKQLSYKSVNYALNDCMYVSMDMGLYRDKQEDSALIVEHPIDDRYKFMLVADGMGGADCGEYASNYVTKLMLKWFEALDIDVFKDVNLMGKIFSEALIEANLALCKKNIERRIFSGTTFVGALVGKYDTVVCNVGDSRAYFYSKKKLWRITKDDSVVQTLRTQGKIQDDDDMRFHVDSNLVTQSLGGIEQVVPHLYSLSNLSYEYLLLFSDGVVDCLNHSELSSLIRGNKSSKLPNAIVGAALKNNSFVRNDLLYDNNYNHFIPGGRDNTTAVFYNRRGK